MIAMLDTYRLAHRQSHQGTLVRLIQSGISPDVDPFVIFFFRLHVGDRYRRAEPPAGFLVLDKQRIGS
jgi:hypothetical protein